MPYSTGTATVTNGSPLVQGQGVTWNDIERGDIIWFPSLNAISFITSVNLAFDELTLEKDWEGASAGGGSPAGVEYVIFEAGWVRYTAAVANERFARLLESLQPSMFIYQVPGLVPDPDQGEEGQWALKANAGAWKIWYRDAVEWVLQGTPAGTNWRGAWSGATSYVANDGVSRLGSAYLATGPNLNSAPESNPADWDLLASKGDTGARGATWTSGTAVPDNGDGANEDFYLRLTATLSDVYKKIAGAWVLQFSNKGGIGDTGLRGFPGGAFAIPYIVDALATADANPGSGKMRFGSAPQNASTVLRFSTFNAAAIPASVSALLNSIGLASTSTIKITGRIFVTADPSKWLTFTATAVAALVGYVNVTIVVLDASSPDPFADAAAVTFDWTIKGDKGDAATIVVASTSTGDPGTAAEVVNLGSTQAAQLAFTIPEGDPGQNFSPEFVVAEIADRDAYDAGPAVDVDGRRLSVLVEEDSTNGDLPTLYFLLSIGPALWSNGFTFAPATAASGISFDNTESGYAAVNAQTAIDEAAERIGNIPSPVAMAMIFGG